MVVSSHMDFGAKTAGCGVTRPGEPPFCARVIPNLPKHPGGMGEPYAYQIINRCEYPSQSRFIRISVIIKSARSECEHAFTIVIPI